MTGVWIIPAVITTVTLGGAVAYFNADLKRGGYASGLLGCLACLLAIILVLAVWLVWALTA